MRILEILARSGDRLPAHQPLVTMPPMNVAMCIYFSILMAAPQPSFAPVTWELKFEFHDPKRITVSLPGQNTQTYWYMLYTVSNESGEDVQFFPSFNLVTDGLDVIEAGDGVSPRVIDQIHDRHEKLYPFFSEPLAVTGPLLQGADNGRTSVAVFRDFDPNTDRFTVFVSGLSGEIARVRNPAFDPNEPESEENQRFFALRKTLAIEYHFPGDQSTRSKADATRVSRSWVMR